MEPKSAGRRVRQPRRAHRSPAVGFSWTVPRGRFPTCWPKMKKRPSLVSAPSGF